MRSGRGWISRSNESNESTKPDPAAIIANQRVQSRHRRDWREGREPGSKPSARPAPPAAAPAGVAGVPGAEPEPEPSGDASVSILVRIDATCEWNCSIDCFTESSAAASKPTRQVSLCLFREGSRQKAGRERQRATRWEVARLHHQRHG